MKPAAMRSKMAERTSKPPWPRRSRDERERNGWRLPFWLPQIVCHGSHDLLPLSFHHVHLEVFHLDSDGPDVRPAILLPISAAFI